MFRFGLGYIVTAVIMIAAGVQLVGFLVLTWH